jgi:hypothetical protein
MRMKYLINIIKMLVPWKRDIDAWRTQEAAQQALDALLEE